MAESPALSIVDRPLGEILGERYLAYALSTIMARSLPDVRDGLKPVHRRLLFSMQRMGLLPTNQPRKSARVVGDVIGRYHPHGEASVYDALVRLAQDFAARYPLILGQGNFGNIDGDSAAAMRYTEARLTQVAAALLDGLDEDAVDFRATYDEDGEEPAVLPARFPNLLANGATGIAVGMATSIPPHNVGELCAALRHLIRTPEAGPADLMGYVAGPDFPTGGVLVEDPAAIREAYSTGRGGFRVRARWQREELGHGQYQVVVTEIPYLVPKSRLVEKIAELLEAKKLPLLDDVRDESAEDVRLVLVPKSRNVEAAVLMESLFLATELENRFPLNMNVLDGGRVPRVMNLAEVLRAFLNHRHDVLIRRSRHRLDKIERRLEILAGYLIAYLNLDEVIRIIREADEPKPALIARFALTDTQAEAILNMRLRALRKLEEIEIRTEHDALSAERAEIEALLADEGKRWQVIDWEIGEIDRAFGRETELGARRTEIAGPPDRLAEMPTEAFVEREPITVLLSEKGWIRAVKGHAVEAAEAKLKEGDRLVFSLPAQTTDKLLALASDGRVYTLAGDRIPRGRGFGEPLRVMVDLDAEAEIVALLVHRPEGRLLLAADDGRGFLAAERDLLAQTRAGRQVLNLGPGAKARLAVPADGDHVAVIGQNRKLLVFPLAEVPAMARGRGVVLQKYRDGRLADARVFTLADGLSWKLGDRQRTEVDLRDWLGHRAGAGRLPPQGFPRNNRFS